MKKKSLWALACFLLFLLLIVLVTRVDVAAVGPEGTSIGLSRLNEMTHRALGEHLTLYKLTQLLGYASLLLAAGFAAFGVWQLAKGRSLKKVDRAIWALGALYVAAAVLYVFFEKVIVNYRPMILPSKAGPEASFPSTHTMMFCVILGSASMMFGRYLKNIKVRRFLQGLCIVLAAVGVVCRLVSGVHWLTDILGGVLISAALLSLFSGVLERIDRS